MTGVPVMTHFDGPAFRQLERIAEAKGVKVATLIEATILRALQPPKDHRKRRSRGEVKPGKKRPYVTLTVEQQRELVKLTRMGWSLAELADRYGCSTATINNWRGRLGCHVSNRSRYYNGGVE